MPRKKMTSDGGNYQIHALRLEQATGKLSGLPVKQQKAIGMILGGCTMVEVARRVEVSRGTIHEWRRQEKFIAALESWRRDVERTTRSRLLGLSGLGFKAIYKALEGGDAKVALQLFKGLGVLEARRDDDRDEGEQNVTIVRREAARWGEWEGGDWGHEGGILKLDEVAGRVEGMG